jgi:hypothetical protein
MLPILAGVETEYGLLVEGRGAEDQVDDSKALVRSYPDECFVGWDYRYESPRADLRGFTLKALAYDPEDAKFDEGRSHGTDRDVRSDRILPNGARLYNDHGHPEYSTPECWSLRELALHDKAGELAVLAAARAFESETGKAVRLYKNNTDFHGASYGTHESYLVPRSLAFEDLYAAVMPMLVARQILTGAGKVGSEESMRPARFQLSQRADFFVEPVNAETLYRRPIFNTRDEPHADPDKWIRLHVISCDANMMASCTARRVGLVKMAIALALQQTAPVFKIGDPVKAFKSVSRDETRRFVIECGKGDWTTAYDVLDAYLGAYEQTVLPQNPDGEMASCIEDCRELIDAVRCSGPEATRRIDWAAKRSMLEQYMEAEGVNWNDPALRSFDLEYHNIDPDEGLYFALADSDEVEALPDEEEVRARLKTNFEPTRALARGLAVSKFREQLVTASWTSLVFKGDPKPIEVKLSPETRYPAQLAEASDVGTFISMLGGTA